MFLVQVCTASPTNCQNLIANPGVSGTHTFQGDPDHAYWFRVWAKDRVENETTEARGPYSTASVTKYYLFGGQRVAMRQGGAVYFLHGDHLGSTSLTTDAAGGLVSQARYTPFGEVAWEGGLAPTDFGFTGQRAERGLGLLDYKARFFAPVLGRFVSADSLIPGAGNPMAWDRYSYINNSPINGVDPSGHLSCKAPHVAPDDCYDPPARDTRIPAPHLTDEELLVLALLVWGESSSGEVPAGISEMKAWALSIPSPIMDFRQGVKPGG
jgi:RHS repeat-associated protein